MHAFAPTTRRWACRLSMRQRLEYPALKRAVREHQNLYHATEILIEDKASGTQLIQELIADGCHG
jgi:phage terminase large subunit-like protein